MPMRTAGVNPFPPLGPPAQARHVGLRAGLVNKHQPGRIQSALQAAPPPPFTGYVRTILLAGPQCLFLYVSPISSKT